MKKETRKNVLIKVAKISEEMALKGGGLPSLFGLYEPEIPEKVKKLSRKDKR